MYIFAVVESCPPGWLLDSLQNKCYWLSKQNLTFHKAEQECLLISNNIGKLAEPRDNKSVQFVLANFHSGSLYISNTEQLDNTVLQSTIYILM